jgi:hypothetical protein
MRWLVIFVAACRVAAAEPTTSCVSGDLFAKDAIHDALAFLASPELEGRAPGSEGDRAARAFIAGRFRCLGLTPAGDDGDFAQAFTTEGHATANLIGVIAGSDPKLASELA